MDDARRAVNDLAKEARMPDRTTAISIVAEPGFGLTVYAAVGGQLQTLTRKLTGGWWNEMPNGGTVDWRGERSTSDNFYMQFANSPRIGGDLKAVYSPVTRRPEIFYVGTDGMLHNFTWKKSGPFNGGTWVHRAPPLGYPTRSKVGSPWAGTRRPRPQRSASWMPTKT